MTQLLPHAVKTVYGCLMHHRAEHTALGEAMQAMPYLEPPKAPTLYIKPSNTFNAWGGSLPLPAPDAQLLARACLGLIFEQNQPLAVIKPARSAISLIAKSAFRIALFTDFSLPHASFYRPPVKFNCLDGSLALAGQSHALAHLNDLNTLDIQTWVNGQLVHRYASADWIRTALAQWQAVNEFIAFEAGDVLMMGCPPDAPLVGAGDVVEVRCEGMSSTRTTLAETA
jgi:5-oxopent-3-ene-1,2,5-tricarboxylate decarboxylase / 2-hydroxyhepta-2,4-diene-1,7-dioate isomerase